MPGADLAVIAKTFAKVINPVDAPAQSLFEMQLRTGPQIEAMILQAVILPIRSKIIEMHFCSWSDNREGSIHLKVFSALEEVMDMILKELASLEELDIHNQP